MILKFEVEARNCNDLGQKAIKTAKDFFGKDSNDLQVKFSLFFVSARPKHSLMMDNREISVVLWTGEFEATANIESYNPGNDS